MFGVLDRLSGLVELHMHRLVFMPPLSRRTMGKVLPVLLAGECCWEAAFWSPGGWWSRVSGAVWALLRR
jgi:hypothetical protein